MALGTIRLELSCLRRALKIAARYEVSSNVSFDETLPSPTNRTRTLSQDEEKRLLEAAPVWLRWLLPFATETALSQGDILRLEHSDIDYDGGVIIPNGGRKKTEVTQASPLTEPVRDILEEIRREQKESKIKSLGNLVFTRDGVAITKSAIAKALQKTCKRAGVKNFRFHDCRHGALTGWARRGIPVAVAMMASGHSSAQAWKGYVNLQQTDVGKVFGIARPFYQRLTKEKSGTEEV